MPIEILEDENAQALERGGDGVEQVRHAALDFDVATEPEAGAQERAAGTQLVRRTATVDGVEFNVYRFSFASETPVLRYDWETGKPYAEVLSHENERDADLRRLKDGGAVRDTHWGDTVGVVDDAELDTARRKSYVETRFSKSARGQEYENDVRQLIRRNVSFRYAVRGKPLRTEIDAKTGVETRWYRWEAIHVAFEPDPADPKVGTGRGREPERGAEVEVTGTTRGKESTMTPEEIQKQQDEAVRAAVEARSADVARILTWGRSMGIAQEKLDEMVARGISSQEAAVEFLERNQPRPMSPPAPADPVAELSRKERKELRTRYDFVRAMHLSAQIKQTGDDSRADGLEGEHHKRLLARAGQRLGGTLIVPLAMVTEVERRDIQDQRRRERGLGTSLAGSGAELVYDGRPLDIIDVLRPALPFTAMGAQFFYNLRGDLPMPRFLTGTSLYHVGENPSAAVTKSNPTTAVNTLRAKSVAGDQPIPNQLMQLSQWNLSDRIMSMIALDFAELIVRGSFHGDGTANQPLGLYSLPGGTAAGQVREVTCVSGDSYLMTYKKWLAMAAALSKAKVTGTGKGYICTTGLANEARGTLKFASAGSSEVWTGPDENGNVAGYRAFATEGVKSDMGAGSDEHANVFGLWAAWNVAIFGDGLEILFDPFTEATKQTSHLHTFGMYDAGTAVPEAFCRAKSAKIS